jgi:hypothetical protein
MQGSRNSRTQGESSCLSIFERAAYPEVWKRLVRKAGCHGEGMVETKGKITANN